MSHETVEVIEGRVVVVEVARATGARGPAGLAGEDGVDGLNGRDGVDGMDGAPGPAGPIGDVGPQGPQGAVGPKGDAGPQGPTGPQGAPGAAGEQGAPGPQGPTGPEGPQGPAGADGAPGRDGIDGAPGEPGAPGSDGQDGAPGRDGIVGTPGADGQDGAPGVGVPVGGVVGQVLGKTGSADFATGWVEQAGGGGLVRTRQVVAISGADGAGVVELAAAYTILSVEYSGPSRLRLYRTAVGRDADAARAVIVTYPGGRGRIYEYVATAAEVDAEGSVQGSTVSGVEVYFQVDGGPVDITITYLEDE